MSSELLCVLLSVLALVQSKTIVINEIVDGKLKLTNNRFLGTGRSALDLGAGSFYPISYEGATLIGLDSLNRTGDCTMVFSTNSITYNYQIGQSIHAVYFRLATYINETGSGYYRARKNSLNYSYTAHYSNRCRVTLGDLYISLDDVEACLQSNCSTTITDATLANFVEKQLTPALNSKLASMAQSIGTDLNRVYCQSNSIDGIEEQISKGLDVLNAFIFE